MIALGSRGQQHIFARLIDRRRRGLAARATSAVVRHALAASIPTIVLNVSQANDAARRVYEHLGFGVHCAFVEGEAVSTRHRS